jgi:hypothetical protein
VALPRVPRELARDLEDHELVGPGGEAAEALEVVDPRQDVEDDIVGALLRDVVELRARQGWQLSATPLELMQGSASKDVVEPRDCLLVPRMVLMQLLDPPARSVVARQETSMSQVGPRGFDAHQLIVDRLASSR